MKCVSVLSTVPDTDGAVNEVFRDARPALGDMPGDLALVFTSPHHAAALAAVSERLRATGLARHVLGCTASTVIGGDSEVENAPALALWVASLPDVTLTPRRLSFDDNGLVGWEAPPKGDDAGPRPSLIVLGDPFSFPAEQLLRRVNDGAPGVRVFGGMASASQVAGGNRLVLDGEVVRDGAVAVEIPGTVRLSSVVSQGCRPIGRTMILTKADRNVIRELGRRPALEVLREVFEGLDPDDQELVQQGLHIGRVTNEYQESFVRGDFLVRNVLGADDAGGIAITDVIRVGQTVQFHVRDADSADEDLRTLLENARLSRPSSTIAGALLFSCNGRGVSLFNQPDHDVSMVHRLLGPVPTAGFFAMGELGPVGGQNFVHGYTASVVLFEEDS